MIRVAVLAFYVPAKKRQVVAIAESLARGMREQGAQVEVFPMDPGRTVSLTGFHYIAVGCDVRSLWKGTLPPELPPALSQAGIVAGKKAFAFVVPNPLGTNKTLAQLMRAIEHEGILLRYSEILRKEDEALRIGKLLKLGS